MVVGEKKSLEKIVSHLVRPYGCLMLVVSMHNDDVICMNENAFKGNVKRRRRREIALESSFFSKEVSCV